MVIICTEKVAIKGQNVKNTHEDSNEHNVETFEIARSDKHAVKLM